MPVFRDNNNEAKTSDMADVKEDDDLSPNGSGRYRMAIGPAKIRLIDYLNNVKSRDYDFSSIVDLLELKKAATNAVSTCTKDLKQVQSTAELLKDYNGKWLKLLSCLSGQALEKEDAIYMKCAGGEKGYVKLMDEALSVSACLEAKLEELKDYQKRVNDQYISSNALSNGVNSQFFGSAY